MATLAIRTELFEQGLFPFPNATKMLTSSVLINLFTNLNLLSSIDYKIKLQHWVDQAIRHIQGVTESDARVYYMTYRALLEDVENTTSTVNKDLPL